MEKNNFLFNNRKVAEYHNLDDYNIEEDEVKYHHNINHYNHNTIHQSNFTLGKLHLILSENFHHIKSYYHDIMSRNDETVRNLFFLILFVLWLENLLGSLSDYYAIKMSIGVLLLLPPMIILFENPNFLKMNSLFEMKNILTIKAFVLLHKKLNFFEILISSFLLNIFEVYFVKKYYIKSDLLGAEIKDKKLRKVNQFKINFSFLVKGYVMCCIWFTCLFNKLEFFVLDEILEEIGIADPLEKKFLYFTFFVLYSSRILVKSLITLSRSQFYFNLIENTQRYILGAIFLQVILSYFLTGGIYSLILSLVFIFLITYIYTKLGFVIFPLIILLYVEGVILRTYLQANFKENEITEILSNFKYSNLSMIISVIFVIIVYYQTEAVRIFHQIYERIFYAKVLFDIFLIISWVYNINSQAKDKYLEDFMRSYRIIFILFVIHYIFIYLAIYSKLNIKIEEKTVDVYFPEIKYDVMNYSKSTPYYEIKMNKRFRFIMRLFTKPLDNLAKSALKNIQTLVMCIISLGFCIIMNDSRLFFLVYLILVQVLQKTYFKHYLNKFMHVFKILAKIIKFGKIDFSMKITEYMTYEDIKIRNPKTAGKIKARNRKHKLIYIFMYPYMSLLWKIILSKIIIVLYEIAFTSLLSSGEYEPFNNTIYRILLTNSQSIDNYFSFWDYLNLFLFLLPNTLLLLYTHFENKSPNIFIQNYTVLNLFGLYINGNIELLILGVLNILVLISLIAADHETYLQFSIWFDVLGISPHI